MIGTTGTSGTRKPRSISGSLRRSQITATFTMKKANSVPMLTSSAISWSGTKAARIGIGMANSTVRITGVTGLLPDRGQAGRRQAVAAHGEGHSGLPVENREHDTRDRHERAEGDDVGAPRDPRFLGQGHGERRVLAAQLVGGERAHGGHGNEDAQDRGDNQRADDRDRRSRPGFLLSSLPVDTASKPM